MLLSREFRVDCLAQRTLTARQAAVLEIQIKIISENISELLPLDLPVAWRVVNCLEPKILID